MHHTVLYIKVLPYGPLNTLAFLIPPYFKLTLSIGLICTIMIKNWTFIYIHAIKWSISAKLCNNHSHFTYMVYISIHTIVKKILCTYIKFKVSYYIISISINNNPEKFTVWSERYFFYWRLTWLHGRLTNQNLYNYVYSVMQSDGNSWKINTFREALTSELTIYS